MFVNRMKPELDFFEVRLTRHDYREIKKALRYYLKNEMSDDEVDFVIDLWREFVYLENDDYAR